MNVLFLNNSFVGEIFSDFKDEVTASFVRRPRLLLLIYHNPVMHDELLRRGFRTVQRSRRTHLYAGAVALRN